MSGYCLYHHPSVCPVCHNIKLDDREIFAGSTIPPALAKLFPTRMGNMIGLRKLTFVPECSQHQLPWSLIPAALSYQQNFIPSHRLQETQLLLTNRKTRLEVTQGHQTWYFITKLYVTYGFLLVCYGNFVSKMRRFSDIRLQKCRDLDIRVRGHLRSLRVVLFDRLYMASYYCPIVTLSVRQIY